MPDSPHVLRYSTTLRVRYADTDKMGIVYYGKYFEYFEVARTEMLRAYALPYAEVEQAGFGLPVSKASAEYFRGAKYDDVLTVVATLSHRVSPKLEIGYTIHCEDELVATGHTTLVFVDSVTGRPSRPPKFYLDAVNAVISKEAARIEEIVEESK